MRILFVDDEPENVDFVRSLLAEVLDATVEQVGSVQDAVAALHRHDAEPVELVITDVFIPVGEDPGLVMGPRARRAAKDIEHLGGLLLLDEIDRMHRPPVVLVHTACNEYAMVELLDEYGVNRVPKPAPVDVLLRAVLETLDLPVPQ
ncbi:MAG: response regulator transcription factor [Alphaproteobacteria bacterium]|nr:response regulator transcription factor [Alphaproteobacteria bacterium]